MTAGSGDEDDRIYKEVVKDLTERIISGDLPPGQRMPSEKALSKEYGVSISVITQALSRLELLCYVWRPPLGKYVWLSIPKRGMSTSSAMKRFLGGDAGIVQTMFDEHAHMLAEKQREWLRSQGYDLTCVCGGCSACLARDYIDLIDPEVNP